MSHSENISQSDDQPVKRISYVNSIPDTDLLLTYTFTLLIRKCLYCPIKVSDHNIMYSKR